MAFTCFAGTGDRLDYFKSHDVICHVIAVAYMEVSLVYLLHVHAFVKINGFGIVAVDIEAHLGGGRVDVSDVFDGCPEEEAADMLSLESWEDVDFLEVENMCSFLLYGEVAAVGSFMGCNEVDMAFFQLFDQIVR